MALLFESPEAPELHAAIARAINTYRQPAVWKQAAQYNEPGFLLGA